MAQAVGRFKVDSRSAVDERRSCKSHGRTILVRQTKLGRWIAYFLRLFMKYLRWMSMSMPACWKNNDQQRITVSSTEVDGNNKKFNFVVKNLQVFMWHSTRNFEQSLLERLNTLVPRIKKRVSSPRQQNGNQEKTRRRESDTPVWRNFSPQTTLCVYGYS
jgi:hypothetical protein